MKHKSSIQPGEPVHTGLYRLAGAGLLMLGWNVAMAARMFRLGRAASEPGKALATVMP